MNEQRSTTPSFVYLYDYLFIHHPSQWYKQPGLSILTCKLDSHQPGLEVWVTGLPAGCLHIDSPIINTVFFCSVPRGAHVRTFSASMLLSGPLETPQLWPLNSEVGLSLKKKKRKKDEIAESTGFSWLECLVKWKSRCGGVFVFAY